MKTIYKTAIAGIVAVALGISSVYASQQPECDSNTTLMEVNNKFRCMPDGLVERLELRGWNVVDVPTNNNIVTYDQKHQPEEKSSKTNTYEENYIRHDYGGTMEMVFMPNGTFTFDHISGGVAHPTPYYCLQALMQDLPCPDSNRYGTHYYAGDLQVAWVDWYPVNGYPLQETKQRIALYDEDENIKSEIWFSEDGNVKSVIFYDEYGNKESEPLLWDKRAPPPINQQPYICAESDIPMSAISKWNGVLDEIDLEILTTNDIDACNINVDLAYHSGLEFGNAGMRFDGKYQINVSTGLGSVITETVLLHEIGHVLGLGHNNKRGSLMFHEYQLQGPIIDDKTKEAVLCVYKDGWEKSQDNIDTCLQSS